jgi:hypothetical protein
MKYAFPPPLFHTLLLGAFLRITASAAPGFGFRGLHNFYP